MSFYGKIYAQMDDVFNSFYFDNTDDKKTVTFIAEGEKLQDFLLGAESFNDKMIMKAGNSWIQFRKIPNPIDDEGGYAVEIFHSQPITDKSADGGSKLILTGIQNAGKQYNSLVSDSSDLLTDSEKESLKALRDSGKLIFFGDKLTFSSPTFDKAGHITGYESTVYTISEIPHLEDFLSLANDVDELQKVVGVDGYPEECEEGTLGYRVKILEDDFVEVGETATRADELAQEAAASAAAAEASAAAAAESAAQAQQLSSETRQELTIFEGEVREDFRVVDENYTLLVGAIGASDDSIVDALKPDLTRPTLIEWHKEHDTRLTANETAIELLDQRVTTEVNTLNGRIDDEVSDLNGRIDDEVSDLNKSIEENVSSLNGRIDSEVLTLNSRIDNEVTLLNGSIGLLEKTHTLDKAAIEEKHNALLESHNELSASVTQYKLNNMLELEEIKGNISTNATNLETLSTNFSSYQESQNSLYEELSGQILTTQQDLSSLTSEVETNANNIGLNADAISTILEQLTVIQNSLLSLEGRVEALEAYHIPPDNEGEGADDESTIE